MQNQQQNKLLYSCLNSPGETKCWLWTWYWNGYFNSVVSLVWQAYCHQHNIRQEVKWYLLINLLVCDRSILAFSSEGYGNLLKSSKMSEIFVWPSDKFWRAFGNLWKVVGNLRKIPQNDLMYCENFKQKVTWSLGDTKFFFWRWKIFQHLKRNFLSQRAAI